MKLLRRYRYAGKHYDSVAKFIARQEALEARVQEARRENLIQYGIRGDWMLVEK